MTDLDPIASRRPAGEAGDGSSLGTTGRPQFRAGGRVLSLFSSSLHGPILRALAAGPVSLAELRAKALAPDEKALRGNIGNLIGIGALGKRRRDGEPGVLDNELTPFGRDLLGVAEVIERWLGSAPAGPIDAESEAAREAVKALAVGWGSTMLRALAVRDLSLSELNALIATLTYPALERRLLAMREAGLLTATAGDDDSVRYTTTDWLREATAPLLAAIRCERRHLKAETMPLARIDAETLLLLSVPLLSVAGDGSCQLAVELDGGSAPAGVTVSVKGRVVSCVAILHGDGSGRVCGSSDEWLDAIVGGDRTRLDFDGEGELYSTLVASLHARLFGALQASS